jgi:predicted ATPase with chaperone activity
VEQAFQRLVVDPGAAGLLSKALRSGRCTMVFGPSGNGKTHLLAEFMQHLEGEVVVPYALYAYGQIIRIFDHTVHVRKDPPEAPAKKNSLMDEGKRAATKEDLYDRRWVRIRRPGVIVGGELTAESLELGYDPITRFYQAPKHLKAQGGVLLVDDFGRQKIGPAELLNRWIMAL